MITAVAAAPAASAPAERAQALVKVTFLEDFFESDAHAGIWVAKDKGFWEKEGLHVAVTPGAGSGMTVQQVAAGNFDFGYANAFVIAPQVQRGADVIAVASPVEGSPVCSGGVGHRRPSTACGAASR